MTTLDYCPDAIWHMIENEPTFNKRFKELLSKEIDDEAAMYTVFEKYVLDNSANTCLYRTIVEEYSFSVPKMRLLAKQDALIGLTVKDLQVRGHEEEFALLITFNGYVLDDSLMMEIYSKL